jgi:NADH dehydrogenase
MTAVPAPGHRPRVLIIGSGFGGLFAAKELAKAPVDVTIVSSTLHHLFQPLLYQLATGILSSGEIAPPTRSIMRRQANISVLAGTVAEVDLQQRVAKASFGRQKYDLAYDYLIVAAGAGQSYFGNDHFADFAPGMKTIDQALEIRGRIFGAFEMAEISQTAEDVEHWLTFVVVGAGPTGVEMAGQIAELAKQTLKDDYRRINPLSARVILVEGADQVLPPFGEKLGGRAQRRLEELGVEVQTGKMVVDMDANGLVVRDRDGNEERIKSRCKVWAAGVAASPLGRHLAEQSGAEVDRAGRVHVNEDLTLPGHPEVFVVGDMMALEDLPGVAQVAMQGGQFAATTIKNRVTGRPVPERFKYFDKGSMAIISRYQAVAKVGRLELAGFDAWVIWLVVHLMYLVGFKNRFTTLVHWGVTFIGNGRAQRSMTMQQVYGRRALEAIRDPSKDAGFIPPH